MSCQCYFISHSLSPQKNTVSSSHHGSSSLQDQALTQADLFLCAQPMALCSFLRSLVEQPMMLYQAMTPFVLLSLATWFMINPTWNPSWISYFVGVFYVFFPLNPVPHGAFVQQMDVAKGLSFGWCNSSSFQTLGDGVQLRSATDAYDIYT